MAALSIKEFDMKIPRLIISDSEHDSNMFHATKALVPDDFVYLEKNGKKEY